MELEEQRKKVNEEIEWPQEEEWQVRDDAKDLISQLLQHNPLNRLGAGGAQEVKDHIYFDGLDWEGLLRQKAEFVPDLSNEEDTSYFDTCADRYNHELETEDTDIDDAEDQLFHSFSSMSPRYSKVYARGIMEELTEAVEEGSPAFEAGLRQGDLITHINEESIHSLLHTQIVQLILRGKEELRIRAMPLENSSIQTGTKKKGSNPGKMARRSKRKTGKGGDKKKSRSLFRRLSTKRAEQQGHVTSSLVGHSSPLIAGSSYREHITGSQYRSSPFSKSWSFGDTSAVTFKPGTSPLSLTWSPESCHTSSNSSSPNSSSQTSPANQSHSPSSYGRPSTLTGFKKKT